MLLPDNRRPSFINQLERSRFGIGSQAGYESAHGEHLTSLLVVQAWDEASK
jgi:hypothetical protein